jgi:hypothetical protein
MQGALAIWESNVAGMNNWEQVFMSSHFASLENVPSSEEVPLFWVPPLTSVTDVESLCAQAAFTSSANAGPLVSGCELQCFIMPFINNSATVDYGKYKHCSQKSPPSCEEILEKEHPVDILFYGDPSPYRSNLFRYLWRDLIFVIEREQVIAELQKAASQRGWNMKLFLRYNLVGTVKDSLIRQAKVTVLVR